MKKDIRSKVKRFLTSEVGRTSVRAPLVLGVAGGVVLLSQITHTSSAANECMYDTDCASGERCYKECVQYDGSTCKTWKRSCVSS